MNFRVVSEFQGVLSFFLRERRTTGVQNENQLHQIWTSLPLKNTSQIFKDAAMIIQLNFDLFVRYENVFTLYFNFCEWTYCKTQVLSKLGSRPRC